MNKLTILILIALVYHAIYWAYLPWLIHYRRSVEQLSSSTLKSVKRRTKIMLAIDWIHARYLLLTPLLIFALELINWLISGQHTQLLPSLGLGTEAFHLTLLLFVLPQLLSIYLFSLLSNCLNEILA